MKSAPFVLLAMAALARGAAAAVPGVPPVPAAAPPGATALWNGRTIDGWTVFLKDRSVDPATVWSAAGGVLHLTGKPLGYLRTLGTFSDYHLHVEWRWPAGASPRSNSGVFVHVHGKDAVWPPGIECQLQAGHAGQLIATEVDLPGAPLIHGKRRASPFHPSSEKPFGQWNGYDIICHGSTIEVYVNGVLQNHVDRIGATKGSIGLQAEGYPVDFRNLWLEPLY